MTNIEYVIAGQDHRCPSFWGIYGSYEYAKDYADKNKDKLDGHYPNGWKIMTYEEFVKGHNDFLLDDPLKEITEDQFFDALEVLPPEHWTIGEGCESFTMSERYSGSIASMYFRVGKRYFTRLVDLSDKSTWITKQDIEDACQY